LASFIDSYHGEKSGVGDSSVANCASCHRAHRILPSEDQTSSIHLDNLQTTCGNCHEGISQELASTRIHSENGQHKQGWPYFFTVLYLVLITATVTGMVLYIIIDLWRQIRNMMRKEQVKRMSKWAVLQHSMLMIIFSLLVITGFALRFSDSWWADLLFGRQGGFPIRSIIHRVSAVLFFLSALMHLFYLQGNRGQKFIKMMSPRWLDIRQFIQMLKFNLGVSDIHPEFGRFSFAEKFEYWALIWGSLIMAVTGTVLWFDNFFSQLLSPVVLDVMRVIHYYEAWLATLSILIWHLYSTVFSPKVYPMNPSWLTGKMPREQYLKEHAGEENAKISLSNN